MGWEPKTIEFCNKYNIPLEYLSDTLNEPKVIPMIRGKAFEFTVFSHLKKILDYAKWDVQKIVMNAQLGSHDQDVTVVNQKSGKVFGGECKLAAKGRFKVDSDGSKVIHIKCMRSRTLGNAMVQSLAPKLGVSEEHLSVHNDQYMPDNFDFVITSIGNAFYQTDDDGLMYWAPTPKQTHWLKYIFQTDEEKDLKDLAYNKIYVISSRNIAVYNDTDQRCTRRKCKTPNNCGFIPNYPILKFTDGSRMPSGDWVELEEIDSILSALL